MKKRTVAGGPGARDLVQHVGSVRLIMIQNFRPVLLAEPACLQKCPQHPCLRNWTSHSTGHMARSAAQYLHGRPWCASIDPFEISTAACSWTISIALQRGPYLTEMREWKIPILAYRDQTRSGQRCWWPSRR